MSEARLATSLLAGALRRKAESQGGSGVVLAKGDATAGSLILILTEKGRKQRVLERLLQADGRYSWQECFPQVIDKEGEFDAFIQRRQRFDPDLWLIELDVASAERFAAEMNSHD